MLLSSTFAEVLEVMVAGGLIVLVMGAMAAIPFLVQYDIEERRREGE
jgi:cell division protein FtsX